MHLIVRGVLNNSLRHFLFQQTRVNHCVAYTAYTNQQQVVLQFFSGLESHSKQVVSIQLHFRLGTLYWLLSPGAYAHHFGASVGQLSGPKKHSQDSITLILQSLQQYKKNHADVLISNANKCQCQVQLRLDIHTTDM